jgi:hypothetical protein
MLPLVSIYYGDVFETSPNIREQSVGVVKCSSYFLTTFDDATPSRYDIILITDHDNIIF